MKTIKLKDIKLGQKFRFLTDPEHYERVAIKVNNAHVYAPDKQIMDPKSIFPRSHVDVIPL